MLGLFTNTPIKAANAPGRYPMEDFGDENKCKPTSPEIKQFVSKYDGFSAVIEFSRNTDGIEIQRATSENGAYYKVSDMNWTMNIYETTSREEVGILSVRKLITGKKYYFKIRAINKVRENGKVVSELKSPWIRFEYEPTLGYVRASVNGVNRFEYKYTISWEKIQGAHGYVIYRRNDISNSSWRKIDTIPVSKKELTFISYMVKTKKNYSYRIRAYRKVGDKYIYGGYDYIEANWKYLSNQHLDLIRW